MSLAKLSFYCVWLGSSSIDSSTFTSSWSPQFSWTTSGILNVTRKVANTILRWYRPSSRSPPPAQRKNSFEPLKRRMFDRLILQDLFQLFSGINIAFPDYVAKFHWKKRHLISYWESTKSFSSVWFQLVWSFGQMTMPCIFSSSTVLETCDTF